MEQENIQLEENLVANDSKTEVQNEQVPVIPFVRLSKKEKKAKKLEQRAKKFAEKRPIERALKKERKKAKYLALKKDEENAIDAESFLTKKRKRSWDEVKMSGHNMIIDLEFDDQMSGADVVSLSTQLRYSYGHNKKMEHPWEIHWTGYGGKLQKEIEKNNGWKNWKVNIQSKPYIEMFEPQNLVYLTADSNNVIETLEKNKIYIIGGIVDHNKLKHITLNKAQQQGIATAQLPISKYLHLNSRKVLTVNQIVEILLNYSESNDWESAFQKTIPQRKIQNHQNIQNEEGSGYEDEDEENENENNINNISNNNNNNNNHENNNNKNNNINNTNNNNNNNNTNNNDKHNISDTLII
jgi:tRNA (guanine9-N1)-methyltransferase